MTVKLLQSRDLTREAPHREALIGGIALGLFAAIFIGWGVFAHLDAGVYAKGQVVVAGNKQEVQHRDGGIVATLSTHEGDAVKAGQVLLTLNSDELRANARSTGNGVIEQKALEARLLAELKHAPTISFPPEFSTYTGEDAISAAQAMNLQRLEFDRRATALIVSRQELKSQITQSASQVTGYQRELESSQRQGVLIQQEIASVQDLYKAGLVPASRMRSLDRSQAQIDGDVGSYVANKARTQEEMGEKRIRIESLLTDRDADDAKDYRAAELQLADLEPKLIALKQQIDRTVVRSPATGKVVGLTVFTVGGVVTAGQKLMDVVPTAAPLVVEAQVPPANADDLKVGQPAEIRISAFHDRQLPKLQGTISKVSADSFTEEKTGVSYFKIEVTVPPSQIEVIRKIRGDDFGLRAGLPAEVMVPLRSRSAIAYLIEPLTHSIWRSFREH